MTFRLSTYVIVWYNFKVLYIINFVKYYRQFMLYANNIGGKNERSDCYDRNTRSFFIS